MLGRSTCQQIIERLLETLPGQEVLCSWMSVPSSRRGVESSRPKPAGGDTERRVRIEQASFWELVTREVFLDAGGPFHLRYNAYICVSGLSFPPYMYGLFITGTWTLLVGTCLYMYLGTLEVFSRYM